MIKKGKLSVIFDSLVDGKPSDEQWYKDRLAICSECEHNTNNITKSNSTLAKLFKIMPFDHCIICKCIISNKCSRKEEMCGLIYINQKPKWNALVVETIDNDAFNIYNNSFSHANIYLGSDRNGEIKDSLSGSDNDSYDYFVVDFGVVDNDPDTMSLTLESKNGNTFNIGHVSSGCGCTKVKFTQLDEQHAAITFDVIPKIGDFATNVMVYYSDKNGLSKSVRILVKGFRN